MVLQWAAAQSVGCERALLQLAVDGVSECRPSAGELARESLRNTLKLRPGFPEAEALLAKLGPGPEPVRKFHPKGIAPLSAAETHVKCPGAPNPTRTCRAGPSSCRIRQPCLRHELLHCCPIPEREAGRRSTRGIFRIAVAPCRWVGGQRRVSGGHCRVSARSKARIRVCRLRPAGDSPVSPSRCACSIGWAWSNLPAWIRIRRASGGRRSPRPVRRFPPPDHAYPFMALGNQLDPADGKLQARKALGFLQRQVESALPERHGRTAVQPGRTPNDRGPQKRTPMPVSAPVQRPPSQAWSST